MDPGAYMELPLRSTWIRSGRDVVVLTAEEDGLESAARYVQTDLVHLRHSMEDSEL